MTAIDYSGQKFHRLTVICRIGTDSRRNAIWLLKCDCGEYVESILTHVKNGAAKSCGCLRKEIMSITKRTHGKSGTSTYAIWKNILSRCNNPKFPTYKNYGARGIKVCKRWFKFENFLEDMGERPAGLEIDRINNEAGYSKDNCRWTTHSQNCLNKRKRDFSKAKRDNLGHFIKT